MAAELLAVVLLRVARMMMLQVATFCLGSAPVLPAADRIARWEAGSLN